jgi:hypothetical protein
MNSLNNTLNQGLTSATLKIDDVKNVVSKSLNDFSSRNNINASNEYLQSNSIVAKFVFLILVMIIFVILINLGMSLLSYFTRPSNSPYLIYGVLEGTTALVIPQDPSNKDSIVINRSNNQSTGIEFSWSLWLILNDNNNGGKYQNIFNKGDSYYGSDGISTVNNGPGLYLQSLKNNENSLHLVMDTVDKSVPQSITHIKGLPFNKWFNVTIRLENKILDVYVNGTISNRQNIQFVPKQNYNDVNICQNGGFKGQLSNLRYFNYALSAFEINNIVMRGPRRVLSKLNQSSSNDSPYFLSNSWYTNQN